VGLWHDRGRPSREVKALALQHIQELDKKAKELLAMKAALEHLVHGCKGDDRPECPIIDSLASEMPCGDGHAHHSHLVQVASKRGN
jgi:hypothetical protein